MASGDKIRCDACPVMCYVAEGRTGACDRYANEGGRIVRCDPVTVLDRRLEKGEEVRPFLQQDWDGELIAGSDLFVSGLGAGTTYPDFKPAPFIVSREVEGVDTVTVVTEAIYSYCGAKVKIDTDRHLGDECARVLAKGEPIGHVTTGEYGSQMLSLGGVDHLTGGSKAEGRATCDTLMALCNGAAVELQIEGGSSVVVQAGQPPIVDGVPEVRMRVGCGSATIGMFASQWQGLVDEVVVVDDHITGVVSEHQAGKVIGWPDTGIRIQGRRSTPGRYFQVAEPGLGWGGTDITDPLSILGPWQARKGARPGLSVLMVSTTGEHADYFVLDEDLVPQRREMPEALRPSVDLIAENCEPALCTVMFCAGAGGSLRSGVTRNPVRLTRAVHAGEVKVTLGGAEAFLWPGGGITVMLDVLDMPAQSFGYVPTPALVAPLEFTMARDLYLALGGHGGAIRSLHEVLSEGGEYGDSFRALGRVGGE
ncbi:6-hydroxynicotinate reductase [Pseudooceanicola sp. CBS1P-1]|uniref:6-hydroxynicotinate reductase n=1 Tax=Pseudooceanicola albus TaxID=2692189 RepID=A0A6L7G6J0_9RHOB|nr:MULTISPECIES: 6-hydroxynicotinate reductase [Pseudooceanicola]MBT9383104.1 6-hydroxynicotinate reductase [Pseudooceanicola endophyticus]MXN19292.1 6-hydroxynicotinate reductase [Pseudooceanicola albus]